ncbi:MAG: Smr/MutS family protein [bacterium]|nr:Smr/MutS family protein [bacterium]MDT8394843.1 Smr/MutS family protein [bacterium]
MSDEPVRIPVDGVLDLHTFQPKEVADLVEEYLAVCRSEGILQVRIIHGKGKGVQRRIVRSLLEKLDYVADYRNAEETAGGWGATTVVLKAKSPSGIERTWSK